MKLTNAVANVIGNGWLTFLTTVKASGTLWYPQFAAFPGPYAPPTPNTPTPFMALTMAPVSISASILKAQMVGSAGGAGNEKLFEAISYAFENSFNLWKLSTLVTNVLGTGPVPTFAPPFVMMGPVLGGTGNMLPGGFA